MRVVVLAETMQDGAAHVVEKHGLRARCVVATPRSPHAAHGFTADCVSVTAAMAPKPELANLRAEVDPCLAFREPTPATLTLDGDSLFSGYGFGDGDALDDWWWDRFGGEPYFDTHATRRQLVRNHLAPAIIATGHRIEVEDIHFTMHNPIRAGRYDGRLVDTERMRLFEPVKVEVTVQDVQRAALEVRRAAA